MKLYCILFRKEMAVHHVSYDLKKGVTIRGQMLFQSALYGIEMKEGSETQGSVIGPKRIKFNPDSQEFEARFLRLHIKSRNANEKILEFYSVEEDPRSLGYGVGNDIQMISVKPAARLAHRMVFKGLWESNILMEERPVGDSQFVIDEYESKSSKKLIEFNTKEFGRPKPNNTRIKSTPYRDINPSRLSNSRLSTIEEVPTSMRRPWSKPQEKPWVRTDPSGWAQDKENSGMEFDTKPPSIGPVPFPRNNLGYQSSSTFQNTQLNQSPYPQPFAQSNPQSTFAQSNPMNPFGQSNPQTTFAQSNSQSTFAQSNPVNPFAQNPQSNLQNAFPQSNPQNTFTQSNPQNPFFQNNPVNSFSQSSFYSQKPVQSNPQIPFGSQSSFPQPFNSFGNSNQVPNPFATAQLPNPFSSNPPQNPPQIAPQIAPQMTPQNPPQNPPQTFTQNIPQNNPQRTPTNPFSQPTNPPFVSGPQQPPVNFYAQPSGFNSQILPASLPQYRPPEVPQKPNLSIPQTPYAQPKPKQDDKFISIPCLILPLPKTLYKQVCSPKPENPSYKKLYETMEYYDVLIKVKEVEIKAHRAVLYSSCPFFHDHLNKLKNLSSALSVAKIIMPNWFNPEAFSIVLKWMYSCNIDYENIDLARAKDILMIADHLKLNELVGIIIVKFVLVQVTCEEVISVLQIASHRVSEAAEEYWEYLIDSCAMLAAEHSNWLVRHKRAECLSLSLDLLIRVVECSMYFINNQDHVTLVIKLLIDLRYADCIFQLSNKITGLYLSGYSDYSCDIRQLDYMRPLSEEQAKALDPSIPMEFDLQHESQHQYLTQVRQKPIPPPVDSFNAMDSKKAHIIKPSKLRARSQHSFSFEVLNINKPRNVMSPCFESETRKWSVLVSTSPEGYISVFLCERGPAENTEKHQNLDFTSVVFEIELLDTGMKKTLRTGNQPCYTAGFYSFPNNQFKIVGERKFCKLNVIKDPRRVEVKAFVRETPIHSGVIHYISESFDSLSQKFDNFKAISFYNLKYVLESDKLSVRSEREAAALLWKYSACQEPEIVNFLIPSLRFEYLNMEDLLLIARDHGVIRKTKNFFEVFKQEFLRRVSSKTPNQNPRHKYEVSEAPQCSSDKIVDWILSSNHHEGFESRINELKSKHEKQRVQDKKKIEELTRRNQELSIEIENLKSDLRRTKGSSKTPASVTDYSTGSFHELRDSRNYELQTSSNECRII